MNPLPSLRRRVLALARSLPCLLAACLLLPACTGNRELARRAHAGEAAAQFEYGRRLLTGQHHWFSAPQHAPAWFKLAALQGYAPAQAALGACYESGLGVIPSPVDARYWYGLAAEQGNPMAAMHLAMIDYRENSDPKRALSLLESAAAMGYIPARLRYAIVLLQGGNASPEDMRRAIDQLRIAAMDGSGEAAYLMGLFYASGKGVPQHSGIALGWFENAADAGYGPAQELIDDLTKGD